MVWRNVPQIVIGIQKCWFHRHFPMDKNINLCYSILNQSSLKDGLIDLISISFETYPYLLVISLQTLVWSYKRNEKCRVVGFFVGVHATYTCKLYKMKLMCDELIYIIRCTQLELVASLTHSPYSETQSCLKKAEPAGMKISKQ